MARLAVESSQCRAVWINVNLSEDMMASYRFDRQEAKCICQFLQFIIKKLLFITGTVAGIFVWLSFMLLTHFNLKLFYEKSFCIDLPCFLL
jgi:hypothetical protein